MVYFRNRKDFLSFYGPVFGGGGPSGPQLEQKFDVQSLRSIPCSEYMSEKKKKKRNIDSRIDWQDPRTTRPSQINVGVRRVFYWYTNSTTIVLCDLPIGRLARRSLQGTSHSGETQLTSAYGVHMKHCIPFLRWSCFFGICSHHLAL